MAKEVEEERGGSADGEEGKKAKKPRWRDMPGGGPGAGASKGGDGEEGKQEGEEASLARYRQDACRQEIDKATKRDGYGGVGAAGIAGSLSQSACVSAVESSDSLVHAPLLTRVGMGRHGANFTCGPVDAVCSR